MSVQVVAVNPSRRPIQVAASVGQIQLRTSTTVVDLAVSSFGQSGVGGELSGVAKGALPARAYIVLQSVRGVRDATVLQIHLALDDVSAGGSGNGVLVGTVGLFGLRRASSSGTRSGLTCHVDITSQATQLAIVAQRQGTSFSVVLCAGPASTTKFDISIDQIGAFVQVMSPASP